MEEGPLKSAKPRALKDLYAPDVKSTKREVRRAGITCKFSITRKRKKGKGKWTACSSMCTLICSSQRTSAFVL